MNLSIICIRSKFSLFLLRPLEYLDRLTNDHRDLRFNSGIPNRQCQLEHPHIAKSIWDRETIWFLTTLFSLTCLVRILVHHDQVPNYSPMEKIDLNLMLQLTCVHHILVTTIFFSHRQRQRMTLWSCSWWCDFSVNLTSNLSQNQKIF